jgi:hypothetical protein
MKHAGVTPWEKPNKMSLLIPVGNPTEAEAAMRLYQDSVLEQLYEKQCRESKQLYLINRYWCIVQNQDHTDVRILHPYPIVENVAEEVD